MATFNRTANGLTGVVSAATPANAFILSGLMPRLPTNMERWPSGKLYVSNGLNKVYSWNGIHGSFTPVGLPTPAGTPTIAGSGAGSISGTYQVYVRFMDEDGNVSPLSPGSTKVTVTSIATFTYGALPTPTDPRVVKRQILRNTDSQYTTFYVDLETTDLWSTSLTSTTSDTTLATNTPVPLFDLDGNSLTAQWSAPRDDKPILIHHRNRMLAAGEMAWTQGNAQVTFGSTTVTGTAANWPSEFANREFTVLNTNAPKAYTISSVNVTNQTLTLSEPYRGATDLFASYAIRPPRAQRNTIYYSQSGQPDQWLPTNAISLEEAGDAVTALIPAPSFIYVAFVDALYRLAFDQDPAKDGSSYRIATRGCVNQRTWIRVGDYIYALDRQGLYAVGGPYGQVSAIDQKIHDVFSKDAPGEYKIDFAYSKLFHAQANTEEQVLRFYVSLGGPVLPRHALCFNYVTNEFWIEEYPFPVACSWWQASKQRLLVGGLSMKLYEQGRGTVDGLNPSGYSTTGNVTSASIRSLTDSNLRLPSSGITGAPIIITAGMGKGQMRLVESINGTTVNVTQPWGITPDTTSKYQIGGIPWRIRTGWYQYKVGSDPEPLESYFSPVTQGSMDLRIFMDHSPSPNIWALDRPLAQGDDDGISYSAKSTDLVVNLARSVGYIRSFLDTSTDSLLRRGNTVSLEARGVTGPPGLFLYSVTLGGASL